VLVTVFIDHQAVGLVLTYRGNRIINFGQVQIGQLGGLLFAIFVKYQTFLSLGHSACGACFPHNARSGWALDLNYASLLHAEQEFEWFRPLVAGEKVTIIGRVGDMWEKQGKSGTLDFVVLEQIAKQEERVAGMREELKKEERELQKLQQAKKVLEATQ